jgi:membrane-bound metal-dependent hydrolase YbcI (DUF457 family)
VRGHTHLLIGGALGIPLAAIIPAGAVPAPIPPFVVSCVLGGVASLLPDIDHEYSTINTFMRRRLGSSAFAYQRHRGGTHSLFGAAVAGVLFGLVILPIDSRLALPAGVIVALGYLSHLLADVMSPSAMLWLWPFRRRPVRPSWIPALAHSSAGGQMIELGTIVVLALVLFLAGTHWLGQLSGRH